MLTHLADLTQLGAAACLYQPKGDRKLEERPPCFVQIHLHGPAHSS